MRFQLIRGSAVAVTMGVVIAILWSGSNSAVGQTPTAYKAPRNVFGQPDISGYWQAINTANWDLEAHAAEAAPYRHLVGAWLVQPPGASVVEGGTIPYKPEALETRKKFREQRLKPDPLLSENKSVADNSDPEAKCYQGGVPRSTYMPYPFQILQAKDEVLIRYQFGGYALRVLHLNKQRSDLFNQYAWNGQTVAKWDGDTLVTDVRWFFGPIVWLDRAGNFYGGEYAENANVVERYTPVSPYHLMYEATITDPDVYTRPWKIKLPLYKIIDPDFQLLELQCIPMAEDFLYGSLYKKPLTR